MMQHGLKKSLQLALEANDLGAAVALVRNDRKALSLLVRLAYDKDTLIGWRAIKAVGLAAREMVKTDYNFLRETCRKLLWSLSDESGGIGWSAPELLGEIVSADPARFCDIIPLIAAVYEVEEEVFRPGVLYALGRIAEAAPEQIQPYQGVILKGLTDTNPLAKAYALIVVKHLDLRTGAEAAELLSRVQALSHDTGETWIYQGNNFKNIQINELAKETLQSLKIM